MKKKLKNLKILLLLLVLISLPIVFFGQTDSKGLKEANDSLICNTKKEQMFFNEAVFQKQKLATENVYLKTAQRRLISIIEQKDEQLIQKDTIIAVDKRIAANNLEGLRQQLKIQKKQKNKTIVILSSLLGVVGVGLGYSLAR